jgi:dTDP-4-dehydrorhamnose 3,5-epimerase
MKIINTENKRPLHYRTDVFGDERGYFFESYNKMKLDPLIGSEYTLSGQ